MKTSSTTFEVLILLFLAIIPWPAPTVFRISCPRDSAKVVRKIVQTKWLPILDRRQVELPLECPFHPARDIFGPQHEATHQHRPSQWTCGFCGKSFYEEKFLERHFDTRHRSQINKAEDAVCFADYCDIMRCQVLVSQDSSYASSAKMPMTDIELWRESSAYTKAVAPSSPREVAKVVLTSTMKQTQKELNHVETENCPKNAKKDEADNKKSDVDGDSNATSELCDKDLVESELPPVDQKTQQFVELEKLKASCVPEDLQKLKVRCEVLVRDCIGSLLLHLTMQEFKEVEEEMNNAVCWYLSCDRYWEDAVHNVRPFPWPLLIAITIILTLAICMCYYIIWIVFDSEDSHCNFESGASSFTTQSTPAHMSGDDAYIYVTYPPDLKRKLLESCYNRTTRL